MTATMARAPSAAPMPIPAVAPPERDELVRVGVCGGILVAAGIWEVSFEAVVEVKSCQVMAGVTMEVIVKTMPSSAFALSVNLVSFRWHWTG